jgi:hypothetical protein
MSPNFKSSSIGGPGLFSISCYASIPVIWLVKKCFSDGFMERLYAKVPSLFNPVYFSPVLFAISAQLRIKNYQYYQYDDGFTLFVFYSIAMLFGIATRVPKRVLNGAATLFTAIYILELFSGLLSEFYLILDVFICMSLFDMASVRFNNVEDIA